MPRLNRLTGSSLLLLLLLSLAGAARGQAGEPPAVVAGPDVNLRLSALIQPRISYAHDGGLEAAGDETELLGFGVRRMRLIARASLADRIEGDVQLEAATLTVRLLDARIGYRISEELIINAGRFISAQPRGFTLTGAGAIDAVDRAVIADTWGRNTIGSDGRSVGLEGRYRAGGSDLRLLIHNGWEEFNVRGGLAGESATGGVDRTGLAASLFFTHRPAALPGLEFGGHGGFNASRNPNTAIEGVGRRYTDASLHAYWGSVPGSQPVRAKADLIGIFFESVKVDGVEIEDDMLGAALFAAVSPTTGTELFSRGEVMRPPRQDATEYAFTAGGTLSISALRGRPFANERLSLAYSIRTSDLEGRRARQMVVLQAQLAI